MNSTTFRNSASSLIGLLAWLPKKHSARGPAVLPQFGFNQRTSQEDLLFGRLMEEEADSLGILVTNEMVNDYLKRVTDDKLTREAFAKIRTSMTYHRRPLDEETLYDILRRQIKARMAYVTLLPTGSVSPPTPDVYWEYFRRMNVRQQINLATLDVEAFLDEVPEPTDAEIAEAFADARTKSSQSGRTGFARILPARPSTYCVGRSRLRHHRSQRGRDHRRRN